MDSDDAGTVTLHVIIRNRNRKNITRSDGFLLPLFGAWQIPLWW